MAAWPSIRRQFSYLHRRTWRLHIFLTFILLVTFLLLLFPPSPRQHITSWYPGTEKGFGHRPLRTSVVVAAQEEDDVSWIGIGVNKGWEVWKYAVDNKEANLTVPANKGNEAMVYLT
jgi:hypothetical protein